MFTLQRLQDVQYKLQKIKQMAEICSKYEHEKDDMFLQDDENDGLLTENYEALDNNMIVSTSFLNLFYMKVKIYSII